MWLIDLGDRLMGRSEQLLVEDFTSRLSIKMSPDLTGLIDPHGRSRQHSSRDFGSAMDRLIDMLDRPMNQSRKHSSLDFCSVVGRRIDMKVDQGNIPVEDFFGCGADLIV